MPRRTPSRPWRSTRTSMPSPMTMASFRLRVTTSTGSGPNQWEVHRIVVIVANELTAEHPPRVDDDRRAQVDRGAAAADGHDGQPQQRVVVRADAHPFELPKRQVVLRIEQPRIDGE